MYSANIAFQRIEFIKIVLFKTKMENLVIHYSEIGIKGKNRDFFEKKLMDNLRKSLGNKVKRVYKRYGRIICELNEKTNKNDVGNTNQEKIKEILELFPGVSSFSFATQVKLDIKNIEEKALGLLKEEEFKTFLIETKRSNKQFPLKSPEINKQIGAYLEENLKKEVDFKNPDIKLYIEIGEKEVFIYTEKHKGIGGLPTGTSGKMISSLSGGIDSPVASFLLMKRGCKVVFVHIHNQNQTSEAVLTKLENLVKQLTKFQLDSKLYVVPFEKIQKEIILKVPSKSRMIIYRRFMTRIINEIAKKEKAKGIITGDSVGQVASQTLENINCIYKVSGLPILSPLIGMNKEEIVTIAKKIGTYEISIVPYPDCCSFMIAQHPETKGKLSEIEKIEENIENSEELIGESVDGAIVKKF